MATVAIVLGIGWPDAEQHGSEKTGHGQIAT